MIAARLSIAVNQLLIVTIVDTHQVSYPRELIWRLCNDWIRTILHCSETGPHTLLYWLHHAALIKCSPPLSQYCCFITNTPWSSTWPCKSRNLFKEFNQVTKYLSQCLCAFIWVHLVPRSIKDMICLYSCARSKKSFCVRGRHWLLHLMFKSGTVTWMTHKPNNRILGCFCSLKRCVL